MKPKVIIAGAGPVGLLTALALARQDIPVLVLEAEPGLTVDLRAGTFHPPSLEIMARHGITQEMLKTAIKVPRWQIRDRREGLIVEWDLTEIADLTPYPFRLHMEQHRVTPIIHRLLGAIPHAEVRFSHPVVNVRQTADKAIVEARTPAGDVESFEADWVIGADGGRSIVRKASGIELKGFTWPERFAVYSTTVDFSAEGYTYNAYIADPDQWFAVFKMPDEGPPGLWRLVMPIPADESDEQALAEETVERRMQYFAKHAGRYPIKYKSLYNVHQRVAEGFRRGRVVLAGDACHLNNPLGAFGLNGGIQDSANLAEKLGQVCRGEADSDLLDLYDRQRRTVNVEYVQEYSIQNLKRLAAKTESERQANFAELRKLSSNPEGRRRFMLVSTMIASMQRANAIQ
jgi:3-(3-hydroxy-phenyl)propionate hydroxylase